MSLPSLNAKFHTVAKICKSEKNNIQTDNIHFPDIKYAMFSNFLASQNKCTQGVFWPWCFDALTPISFLFNSIHFYLHGAKSPEQLPQGDPESKQFERLDQKTGAKVALIKQVVGHSLSFSFHVTLGQV